jgi:hypothetical protein
MVLDLRLLITLRPLLVRLSEVIFKQGGLTSILGVFTELRKATVSFVMSERSSVRPHGTNQLPLQGFS